MTPVLSVLMPVRNGERTIGTAATSTLRAMPAQAELLVWDDGSSDGTVAVLTAIRDPRLVVLGASAGIGVAGGLNRLLEAAGAPMVARIDADDLSLPGRFDRQRRALDAGADITFAGHLRFGDSVGSFRQKRPWHLSPATMRLWLALENPVTHPAMFGRTALLREVGGYRAGPAEDYELWLRLASHGARISRTFRPGIAYRMHADQVTMRRGYLRSLLEDPALHRAHDALTADIGWRGPTVWPFLWVPTESAEDGTTKREFWAFLRRSAARLPAFQRRLFTDALARGLPGSSAPGFSAG